MDVGACPHGRVRGSYDIYFGPSAPEGLEGNCIHTNAGKGWWSVMRLYGPGEPAFDGTWRRGDIVETPNLRDSNDD